MTSFLEEAILGYLGVILAGPRAILEASWAILGPSWAHLGPFGGGLGTILGSSWPVLGPSWPILGPSWAHRPVWGLSQEFEVGILATDVRPKWEDDDVNSMLI